MQPCDCVDIVAGHLPGDGHELYNKLSNMSDKLQSDWDLVEKEGDETRARIAQVMVMSCRTQHE